MPGSSRQRENFRVSGVGRRASGVGLGLALLLVAACSGEVSSTTTTAPTVPDTTSTTIGVPPGFARATVLVSGTPWVVAVADTSELRSQGLMGVTDLGDLSGMLFVFEEDTEAGFWMKDTLIPLDAAFFTADGSLVDLIPMVPCADDSCPTYHAAGPYRYALEAAPGSFDAIDRPTLQVTGG